MSAALVEASSKHRDREHGARLAQRLGPAGTVGEVADRVGVDEDHGRRARRRAGRCLICSRPRPPAVPAKPGPAPGRQPTSRSAAARWRRRGRRSAPPPSASASSASAHSSERVERRRARRGRGRSARPRRPRVLPGRSSPAISLGDPPRPRLASGRRVAPSPSSRGERGEERGRLAGRVAGGLLGAAVERGRAVGGDRPGARRRGAPPCAAAGRGSASSAAGRRRSRGSTRRRRCRRSRAPSRRGRERRADRRGREARRSRSRAASRAPRGRSAGPGSPPRSRPGRRRSPRPCRGRGASCSPRPPRAPRSQSARGCRPTPRLGDPLLGGDHLEAEAALVAEPAVVDLVVVAGEHALDALVADRELDVALARAQGADRARVLDVPGPGAEAVGLGGQRARPGRAR